MYFVVIFETNIPNILTKTFFIHLINVARPMRDLEPNMQDRLKPILQMIYICIIGFD